MIFLSGVFELRHSIIIARVLCGYSYCTHIFYTHIYIYIIILIKHSGIYSYVKPDRVYNFNIIIIIMRCWYDEGRRNNSNPGEYYHSGIGFGTGSFLNWSIHNLSSNYERDVSLIRYVRSLIRVDEYHGLSYNGFLLTSCVESLITLNPNLLCESPVKLTGNDLYFVFLYDNYNRFEHGLRYKFTLIRTTVVLSQELNQYFYNILLRQWVVLHLLCYER